MTPNWIPVVEKQPEQRVVVIVGRDNLQGGTTNFAGWLVGTKWFRFEPKIGLVDHCEMRATDFWLSLPEWPAGSNVMDGGYPA